MASFLSDPLGAHQIKIMRSVVKVSIFLISVLTMSSFHWHEKTADELEATWGFWAHRRINRLAVFTLPTEMIGFYKKHIEYITEHAIDPDKRRYASRFEAPRHFIDIDHWGTYPFPEVPRDFVDALMRYTAVHIVNSSGDTLQVLGDEVINIQDTTLIYQGESLAVESFFDQGISQKVYEAFFRENIYSKYYAEDQVLNCDVLKALFGNGVDCQSAFFIDHFSEYGIVPYHLNAMQYRLTNAFKARNEQAILRLSAEMGHYIGDGHVPLHTTENYNGQLTNQVGIHAFWESRIPELFADDEYDYFVGAAQYIENPKDYYWEVVLDSHSLLDSVLLIEKELKETLPEDQLYCYEERLGRTIRTQCRAFAKAYQDRMGGMVESRMQDAIHSIGNAWYTAWINAGQPDLSTLGLSAQEIAEKEAKEMKDLNNAFQNNEIQGRKH